MRKQQVRVDYWFNSLFEIIMLKQDRYLKGIKVVQEKLGWAPQRKIPIKSKILQQISTQWAFIGKITILWEAALVRFFGSMQASKLMIDQTEGFNLSQYLGLNDVATDSQAHPTMMQITLKKSKTDPFRKEVTIILGNKLCPVQAFFT